jgi:predicted ATPase
MRRAAATEPLPPALAPRHGPPFVGRSDLLKHLCDAWAGAVEGVPQLWLVAGEPGIGKTRLAAELAAIVHDAGGHVLYATAAGEDRHALFDVVAGQLFRPPGTLLVLDDLHCADRAALLPFQRLLTSPQPSPLLVVATYRHADVDLAHPLAEVLCDLRREHPFGRILLDGLGPEDLAVLVAGVTGSSGTEGFVHSLYDQTEGNPSVAQEVLRDLDRSGSLEERMAGGS